MSYFVSRVPPELVIPPIALVLLASTMFLLTLRYLFNSGRFHPDSIPVACRNQLRQIKYFAILSFATGVMWTVLFVRRELLRTSGLGWDKMMRPIGEAIIAFSLGLFVFMIGLVCMIAILERSSRLIARQRA